MPRRRTVDVRGHLSLAIVRHLAVFGLAVLALVDGAATWASADADTMTQKTWGSFRAA